MPGLNGLDVLRTVRSSPRLRDLPVIFVSVSSTLPALEGEWAVAKPIDRGRLTDVLDAAIQAKRSHVLVLAPEKVRAEVEPALDSLDIDYRWVTSPEEAARVGAQGLFEVALVHASVSNAPALLQGSALRGRRRGRSVILFSTEGEWQTQGMAVGMPVFPIPQAVSALRAALGDNGPPQSK
jgi:PleD family two-component response regulator